MGGYSYLLANASTLSAEDGIPAQQTCEEAVIPAFLPAAAGVDVPEKDHGCFIDHRECGKVSSVLARCFQDELDLLTESMLRSY